MTFDNGESVIAMHRSQHRYVGVVLDDGAQLRLVPGTAQLIEDDAGDADLGVEGLVAQDQRGDATGHAARVDDQHHRGFEQGGERRVAVAAVEAQAVVQTFVAFDQGDISAAGTRREAAQDFVAPHEIEIEVVTIAPGGQGQPHGIDEIGAFLEWLDDVTAGAQGGAQADAQRGFARGFMSGGDEQTIHAATPGRIIDRIDAEIYRD